MAYWSGLPPARPNVSSMVAVVTEGDLRNVSSPFRSVSAVDFIISRESATFMGGASLLPSVCPIAHRRRFFIITYPDGKGNIYLTYGAVTLYIEYV